MGKHLAHPTNLIGVAEVYFIPSWILFSSNLRSGGRANPERRHAVLSGVINCGEIFLGAYNSYTKKSKNKGAAFEIKIAAVNGSR